MYATFTTTKKGTWAYIQKSVRKDGKTTTLTIKRLGLLSDIQKQHGCQDPRKWVTDLAKQMTEEERNENKRINIELSPSKPIIMGNHPLRYGGDLMLLAQLQRLTSHNHL